VRPLVESREAGSGRREHGASPFVIGTARIILGVSRWTSDTGDRMCLRADPKLMHRLLASIGGEPWPCGAKRTDAALYSRRTEAVQVKRVLLVRTVRYAWLDGSFDRSVGVTKALFCMPEHSASGAANRQLVDRVRGTSAPQEDQTLCAVAVIAARGSTDVNSLKRTDSIAKGDVPNFDMPKDTSTTSSMSHPRWRLCIRMLDLLSPQRNLMDRERGWSSAFSRRIRSNPQASQTTVRVTVPLRTDAIISGVDVHPRRPRHPSMACLCQGRPIAAAMTGVRFHRRNSQDIAQWERRVRRSTTTDRAMKIKARGAGGRSAGKEA